MRSARHRTVGPLRCVAVVDDHQGKGVYGVQQVLKIDPLLKSVTVENVSRPAINGRNPEFVDEE